MIPLDRELVRDITDRGGTVLGTVNRGQPFEYPLRDESGREVITDVSERVLERYRELGAGGLIAIGGDGSLRIAARLAEKGMNVIVVPKTIDNDLGSTEVTFGFDSAMSFATDAIGRLRSSAEAHSRVMVVEVMGRYAGWIALYSGLAGSAHAILLPEIDFDIERVCAAIRHRFETGRPFAIVVVAEGAKPRGGERLVRAHEQGKEVTLGGVGAYVAEEIARLTRYETRSLVLGHLQRGGSPTAKRPRAGTALRRRGGAPRCCRCLGPDGVVSAAADGRRVARDRARRSQKRSARQRRDRNRPGFRGVCRGLRACVRNAPIATRLDRDLLAGYPCREPVSWLRTARERDSSWSKHLQSIAPRWTLPGCESSKRSRMRKAR